MFEVETDEAEGVPRVRLIGELDLGGFDRLDDLLATMQANGHADLLIDLRGLTFLDSSGLHAIVRAHERARDHDGTVRLIPGPPAIQRLSFQPPDLTHLSSNRSWARRVLSLAAGGTYEKDRSHHQAIQAG